MKRKSFRYLWVGQALANSGDLFYIVGLMAIVHGITGSAMFMALIPFATTMARFISGSFAPILMDKYNLKSLLASSQIGKTAMLFLLIMTDYALGEQEMTVYAILGFVFLISLLDGWAAPASHAMLPRLVDTSELTKANSFIALVDQMIQLGGWAVGGLLVAALGGSNVIWVTFVLAAAAAIFMRLIEDQHETTQGQKEKSGVSHWSSIQEGWILIWREPSLRAIHVIFVLETIAGVIWIAAIIYVYVAEVLHREEAWWGYINASFFLGLMLGGLFGMRAAEVIDRNIRQFVIISSFGISFMTFGFGLTSLPWLALVFSAGFGMFEQLKAVSLQTTLQRSVSVRLLPKVYAAQSALISLVFGVSTLLFGFITDQFGVRATYIIAAAIMFISGCYALRIRSRLPEIGEGLRTDSSLN
ncbi:major facilitator superfamily MFS_1 [Paenibacillus vortex V453]|uniref:Major facilitator superfamily MFS_1 n=1 Tax=Paenibacillus vortex V453 TaxID=715225 RepID=A0A2R9T072_9BACL|nr:MULTISPECIES: MFS transporter [Paenibacillus]EFU43003.1 major facilitator superfamily MFS_1 [Paenibacillus vortex V453]MDH6671628.1 DHA3 family macrolide efflux protein-like MFS transporter [Paenibacillus sp. LBL]